ncbi:hypothetical protein LQ948_16000 [Jiella sp. MQZ9-1]|uniref:PhnA-like protein n=1 Tax=Jiella flava TaxID=2816857 RepID=A0A939FZ33_9HYPH|nr:hypothetical protein [Jiella flava]MBO0664137.1 hypothetical protein [Jiella flava]MCD2472709.1 hypothetical protein [Jiella flava]
MREATIADLSGVGRDKSYRDGRMSDFGRERGAATIGMMRRISWGAILAGAILALMIQFMLGLLGLGIGLAGADGSLAGMTSVPGLWAFAVVLLGVFIGAFAAARFAGVPSRIDGMLHGLVTWAVTGLLALYLLTSGTASVVGGAFGVLGQSIDDLTRTANALASGTDALSTLVERDAGRLLAPPAAPQPVPAPAAAEGEDAPVAPAAAPQPATSAERQAAIREVAAALAAGGDTTAQGPAVEAISRTAGVGRSEAERRYGALKARYDQTQADQKSARHAAAGAMAKASLTAFAAMLLGFVVGGLGGLFGRPGRPRGETAARA